MTTDLSVYLDQAQRAGAEAAEVYCSRSFSRPVFLRQTVLNNWKVLNRKG
ncbi:hypothetical protein [Synechocystis salina]|nr:hypothetical protein [Synechocystis salina]